MSPAAFSLTILAVVIALAGALAGVSLNKLPNSARMAVPFSGGLLLGVSLFGLLPELTREIGWLRGLSIFAAGYLLLLVIDRHVHAVCPSCAHDHNHSDCLSALHGYTVPLSIAASLHAFLDGWGMVSALSASTGGVRIAFPIAVMLHKAPEGLALGAIFRASTKSRWTAFGFCALAEIATPLGGFSAAQLTPRLGSAWTNYPLALAGGCFFYLGFHAIHGEWKRRGARAAFAPAFTGIAGAAVLQESARLLW